MPVQIASSQKIKVVGFLHVGIGISAYSMLLQEQLTIRNDCVCEIS